MIVFARSGLLLEHIKRVKQAHRPINLSMARPRLHGLRIERMAVRALLEVTSGLIGILRYAMHEW